MAPAAVLPAVLWHCWVAQWLLLLLLSLLLLLLLLLLLSPWP
jgi:hypothetical protein